MIRIDMINIFVDTNMNPRLIEGLWWAIDYWTYMGHIRSVCFYFFMSKL